MTDPYPKVLPLDKDRPVPGDVYPAEFAEPYAEPYWAKTNWQESTYNAVHCTAVTA